MAKKQKTKVTGAKTSTNNSSERKLAGAGINIVPGAGSANRAYRILKKEGLGGTAQNPSASTSGLRWAADVLGEDSSTIPMRKRTVRSLTTDGPKPTINKSPMSGRDVPLPATSNKQLVKDAKSALKTARKTKRQSRRA